MKPSQHAYDDEAPSAPCAIAPGGTWQQDAPPGYPPPGAFAAGAGAAGLPVSHAALQPNYSMTGPGAAGGAPGWPPALASGGLLAAGPGGAPYQYAFAGPGAPPLLTPAPHHQQRYAGGAGAYGPGAYGPGAGGPGAGGGGFLGLPQGGDGYYAVPGGPHGGEFGMGTDLLYANRAMRHGFLQKVLGIVAAQLLLTAAVAAPLAFAPGPRSWLSANTWAVPLAAIVTFGTLICMVCSEAARRSYPSNILLLAAFTVAQGVLVGVSCAAYSSTSVLLAVVLTAAVCLALVRRPPTGRKRSPQMAEAGAVVRRRPGSAAAARRPPGAPPFVTPPPPKRCAPTCKTHSETPGPSARQVAYALQTKFDFTAAGGMLYSATWVLLLSMLASAFVPGLRTLDVLIAGCGALVFCCYLVYDVQVRPTVPTDMCVFYVWLRTWLGLSAVRRAGVLLLPGL